MQNGILQADDIEIRPSEFVALAGGKPLDLTVRELELLTALVERRGRIVSREELYRVVWGESFRMDWQWRMNADAASRNSTS